MPAKARITAIVKRIAFVPNAINFESLKVAAGGNLKPPPVHTKTITVDIQQVFKQFAIYPLIFFGFAKSFYTIVSYHLMGYVIRQYPDKIGYKVECEDFEDPTVDDCEPQKSDPEAAVLSAALFKRAGWLNEGGKFFGKALVFIEFIEFIEFVGFIGFGGLIELMG